MKKLLALMSGIIVIILLLLFGVFEINHSSQKSTSNKVLNIYNWGDYIDPELIKEFEKQSGYKVNYETFDSNEAMYTKIKQGGTSYDIAIPSEYMIEKMKSQKLLVPLDKSKIKGLNNIDPKFLNQPFDKHNKYSVPYFWGTLGIIYNDKYVKPGSIQTWNDLWNPKYKNQIMFVDGAREFMGLGLNSLGYSLNSKNDAQIKEAYGKLKQLTPNAKAFVADEIKTYMKSNEASIAVTFSGEAADMLAENKHLHYVIPKDQTNLWFDNIVIPKTSKNQKGAYEFINFMLEPKNAAKNAEYIGYATPNKKAKEILPKSITNNRQFYPDDEMLNKMEVYQNLGSTYLEKYNDYFLELKMYRS
ncbi:spermidine putrescine abc transporter permease component potc [Ligilactobacillus hayakitensis DSM 18933 = JCM 14209]|uniref:Spermidine putrescine abc transporter permease component potc n=1 Tax=Ligilactobacillus hayakitensis DSM 18933 = JCM 14209 TaxID=1423755 RepID=A0A0R1WWJ1_9LACO|nr:ABC transporter substrate-binding protein [Ligilactobacillus hayakitensis]KRM19913.1 spermidine putrescine abc transporter permease component potc [Ligilactobacillus hayakitensis DSM 18933 = JCM 14209]